MFVLYIHTKRTQKETTIHRHKNKTKSTHFEKQPQTYSEYYFYRFHLKSFNLLQIIQIIYKLAGVHYVIIHSPRALLKQ
jgi:hypothetical protein